MNEYGIPIEILIRSGDQPAGFRAHVSVALRAAMFAVVSTTGSGEFDRPRAESALQAKVTRVVSQVDVGIGFLGAGVIFRQGTGVWNLTTAASLLVTAAVGVAAGVGSVSLAAADALRGRSNSPGAGDGCCYLGRQTASTAMSSDCSSSGTNVWTRTSTNEAGGRSARSAATRRSRSNPSSRLSSRRSTTPSV